MFINLVGNGGGTGTAGVTSLNDQKGDLKLKTVNNNDLLGEGNIEIQAGVTSVNGQEGAVVIDVPSKVSQLENDANFQTKEQVTVSINEAMSGATGSDDVIVLDNFSQQELTALYNKIDKTKPIKEIFEYRGSRSFYTYYDDGYESIIMFFLEVAYKGGNIRSYMINEDGIVYGYSSNMNYPNFLFFNVEAHTDEGADLNCEYDGDYFEFLVRPFTAPNGYFLVLQKGIGDSTKRMVLPLNVLWDKEYDNSNNIPIRIQFTANNKLYTYLRGDTNNKWTFESSVALGNINSSEVSNIKVLTQAEYDAIDTKDEKTLYMIKG